MEDSPSTPLQTIFYEKMFLILCFWFYLCILFFKKSAHSQIITDYNCCARFFLSFENLEQVQTYGYIHIRFENFPVYIWFHSLICRCSDFRSKCIMFSNVGFLALKCIFQCTVGRMKIHATYCTNFWLKVLAVLSPVIIKLSRLKRDQSQMLH